MSDIVSVPAEKIAALRHHLRVNDNVGGNNSPGSWRQEIVDAARAVVDAVETEDGDLRLRECQAERRQLAQELEVALMHEPISPRCKCGCPKDAHTQNIGNPQLACGYLHEERCNQFTPAPSPARDDAEKAKLTDAEKAEITAHVEAGRTWQTLAYVECILAAHMAALDELTALRALEDTNRTLRRQLEKTKGREEQQVEFSRKLHSDLDGLRERIRALADEWEREGCDGFDQWAFDRLRDLLGDA